MQETVHYEQKKSYLLLFFLYFKVFIVKIDNSRIHKTYFYILALTANLIDTHTSKIVSS